MEKRRKGAFFVSSDAEMMAVDITPDPVFHAGVAHRLFQLKNAVSSDPANYDVRQDGQQFLIFMRQSGGQDAPITVVVKTPCGGSGRL